MDSVGSYGCGRAGPGACLVKGWNLGLRTFIMHVYSPPFLLNLARTFRFSSRTKATSRLHRKVILQLSVIRDTERSGRVTLAIWTLHVSSQSEPGVTMLSSTRALVGDQLASGRLEVLPRLTSLGLHHHEAGKVQPVDGVHARAGVQGHLDLDELGLGLRETVELLDCPEEGER